MEWGAVFLATIIASIIGTLIMGLVANVPYAQAPGMGLNAFFVYTVCFGLGFTWQQALSMVFICGLFNIVITVTKIRKYIIKAIPKSLQNAIGGGIGVFVAYIGFLNIDFVAFSGATVDESGAVVTSDIVPALATLNQPALWLFLIGLVLMIVLLVCKRQGRDPDRHGCDDHHRHPDGRHDDGGLRQLHRGMRGAPVHVRRDLHAGGPAVPVHRCGEAPARLITIFAFSISDTFDTIGTFIGTGAAPASSARKMRR